MSPVHLNRIYQKTIFAAVFGLILANGPSPRAAEHICHDGLTVAAEPERPWRQFAASGLPGITFMLGSSRESLDRYRQVQPLSQSGSLVPSATREIHARQPPMAWEIQLQWSLWPVPGSSEAPLNVADRRRSMRRIDELCRQVQRLTRSSSLASIQSRLEHRIEAERLLTLVEVQAKTLSDGSRRSTWRR
ncbi:MAG: hypothetical protein ACNA8W_25230 [Bradymonadaceae bacterium]